MSLNKAIKYKKEYRKQYRGAKSFDTSCRNHGNCDWCYCNRTHLDKRNREAISQRHKNWLNGEDDD